MTTNAVVVGVDVAKDRLDVAVRPSGEVWSEGTMRRGSPRWSRGCARSARR